LKNKGLQGRIKFVGFDLNTVIRDAILTHELNTAIVQAPFQIGYMGVKMAYRLIQKENVPKKIFTDTILPRTIRLVK
jgi:ribose transport system substrate-binding protein